MSVMMVQTKCKLKNFELFLKLFHIQCKEIGNNKYYEEKMLNALKQITFVKGRLNFSCKSTTAANVDLTESLLDNWLRNNHIAIDKIYYLRSLFVFFLRILVFKVISQPQKTSTKTESCGNSLIKN